MEAKERIILKANELFNRFGFRRVTMDEIALKTGMSKKTIYQCFATKDDIVDTILAEHIGRNVAICEEIMMKAENAVHEIFLSMQMKEDMMSRMHPTVIEDLEKFFPSSFAKLFDHKHDYIKNKIRNNIEWGMKDGLYRSDIHVDIITKFRMETVFMPFNQSIFPYSDYNLLEVEMQTMELFVYGLCTQKGQKLVDKYKQLKLNNKTHE